MNTLHCAKVRRKKSIFTGRCRPCYLCIIFVIGRGSKKTKDLNSRGEPVRVSTAHSEDKHITTDQKGKDYLKIGIVFILLYYICIYSLDGQCLKSHSVRRSDIWPVKHCVLNPRDVFFLL